MIRARRVATRTAASLACAMLAVSIGDGGPWAGVALGLSPQETIAGAARKVVKVHGAGGLRGLESYQTGILVSPTGHVVTVLSTVLDADEITCVLDDGRRFTATLVGADPQRELAVLSIEADELPAFVLGAAPPAPVGTRVFALSNLFGVAVGDERVSAQHGVVSALVPLEARRGSYEVPFSGEVYLLDCTTSNPGSAGGAVVDWRGRLLGMLGKEVRSGDSGIWLNYAVPAAALAAGYERVVSGAAQPDAAQVAPVKAAMAFDPAVLGLVLVPDLLDRTPPFIETVVAGSVAGRAGLRADDLVVAVGTKSVASRVAVQQALAGIAEGDPVRLSVVRDGTIVECDLGPRPPAGKQR